MHRPTARPRRAARALALGLGMSLAASLGVIAAGPAQAGGYPPLDWATVHPGVLLVTDGKGCTANFVFTDAAKHFYIGQAAHCAASGDVDSFDGCLDATNPLGTEVRIAGSEVTGTLAYTSWGTMQAVGEADEVTCRSNDFALVRLPDSVATTLNPSVPFFGGPSALSTADVGTGDNVYSYGNSSFRFGIHELSPKQGLVLDSSDDGWIIECYFLLPVIPGDSGSAVLDDQGRALGVASSLNVVPHPASNGIVSLAKALAYAQKHSGIKGLQLVPGTEKFGDF